MDPSRTSSVASAPTTSRPASHARHDDLAIEITGLTRRFGASRALNQVDLFVPWEQRLAILGPNGAGKTTLLRILATLARPTRGRVIVGGLALPENARAIRRHVGVVAHQTFLYDELTVRENLSFYARLYGVADLRQRIDALLGLVGLADRADDRVRTLSRGLQQRAALARAIVHDPPILLLDEPDTGLDVAGAELIGKLLLDSDGGRRTVLMATHNVERVLDLADRALILINGKVVRDESTDTTSASSLISTIRQERGAA